MTATVHALRRARVRRFLREHIGIDAADRFVATLEELDSNLERFTYASNSLHHLGLTRAVVKPWLRMMGYWNEPVRSERCAGCGGELGARECLEVEDGRGFHRACGGRS